MTRRTWRTLPAALAAFALVGCASSTTLVADVGALQSGVAGARQQAQLSFDAANKAALDQAIALKVADAGVNLGEADLTTAVKTEDIQAWSQAFDILDAYCTSLKKLSGTAQSQTTGNNLAGLGAQLQNGPLALKIPAGLQGLFATFGQALVQAQAAKTATDVMRTTDPAFHQVVDGMAAAIGSSPQQTNTLQFQVASNWVTTLAGITVDYSALRPTDQAGRRQVITRYLAAMKARDDELQNLSQLHASLLALGEAHSAAAKGKPGDALYWIGQINTWLDEVKQRTDAAKKAQG
jgi:hypothetical protein